MNRFKRQQIIHAAIDLFAEKGVDKVSVDGIAEFLGVSKGSIYYHFRQGKNDILAEILKLYENYIKDCVPDPKEWESEDADAEKILFKLFFQFPEKDMLRFRKIVHIIMSGMHNNEQLKRHAIEDFINGRERLLADCLSTLRKNGKIILSPLEPDSAARFLNRYMVTCAIMDSSRYPYIDDTEKARTQQEQTVRDCTGFINLLLGK